MTKSTIKEIQRPDIDEYFLKIAAVVAERSTCIRRKIGAVAVTNKHILATGYNGAPAGLVDCLTLGCIRNKLKIPSGQQHEICRAVHAEQNVIIQAALHGASLEGATIYCTNGPCILCKKMLINAKIKRFVTYAPYTMSNFETFINFTPNGYRDIFEEAGIKVEIKPKPSSKIENLQESVNTVPQKQKSIGVPSKINRRVTYGESSTSSIKRELPF